MTLSDYPPCERDDEWSERVGNFWEWTLESTKLVAERITSRQSPPISIVMKNADDSPGVN